MAVLTSLKLVASKRPSAATPAVHRRNKLLKQLGEQMELAKAFAEGSTYAPTKQKRVLDVSTGERSTVTVSKRVKQWWWAGDNGKLQLSVRYGSKVLTLNAKTGANAIECTAAELTATLTTIRTAVEAGELDAAIEAASQAVRANFK